MPDDATSVDLPAWAVRLRAERRQRLWSQKEMARRLVEAADEETRGRLPARESIVRRIRAYEAGHHRPDDPYRVLYARALGLSEDDLFGEHVLRREFFGTALAALGLTAAPPQISRILAGRRVGADLVDQLLRRIVRLRHLDNYLGGADTYRLYADEVTATSHLIHTASYTQDVGRQLRRVLAEQAQQAGWAAFDAGWHDDAHQMFRTALAASNDGEDATLAANTMAFLAYQKVSTGRSGAREAAASVATAPADAPPAVRALLNERAAWAYAVEGKAREAEVALNTAREALDEDGAKPAPDWAAWVDRVELDIMTGRCWTQLRRPLRAVPTLESAMSRYDDSHARDKSLYLTWLAEAYLDAHEVEQAASTLGRAFDLCTGVASIRPQQRVSTVMQRLSAHRSLPVVAELFDRTASPPTMSPGSPIPGTLPSQPSEGTP